MVIELLAGSGQGRGVGELQCPAVDLRPAGIGVRAGQGQHAQSVFRQRAAAAAHVGGKLHVLAVGVDAPRLTGGLAEARGIVRIIHRVYCSVPPLKTMEPAGAEGFRAVALANWTMPWLRVTTPLSCEPSPPRTSVPARSWSDCRSR